jgi:hypothetical protein
VPACYESGRPALPSAEHAWGYLEQRQVVVGNYWHQYGWVAPVMEISDLEAGYGLAAGKPMLVGYWRVRLRTASRGLTAMIVSIGADGVASYRASPHPGAGLTFSRRPGCPAKRKLCGGGDQH